MMTKKIQTNSVLLLLAASFLLATVVYIIDEKKLFLSDEQSLSTTRKNGSNKYHKCSLEEGAEYPNFCRLMTSASALPLETAKELYEFAKRVGTTVEYDTKASKATSLVAQERRGLEQNGYTSKDRLPSVLAHGMGDSCFNPGMKSMTERVSTSTGTYATCIPTGPNFREDTMNGYFLNMDASIDIFASKVQTDANLKDGFNAVGFSQGNNLIRGYIALYNDPPVKNFISINGVNAGVGAVPYCIPKSGLSMAKDTKICNALMETASHRAYNSFAQKHSFQANYWRDPRTSQKENYLKFSQLARLNNEVIDKNATLNENYAKTNRFVWVRANDDKVVWPPEGEHWGAPDSNDPFNTILPMNVTEWYMDDLFGLKTADKEGKNFFESFDGNHLQFSLDEFDKWIEVYFNS